MITTYIAGCDVIFIVYSIWDRRSFRHVEDWFKDARKKQKEYYGNNPDPTLYYIIGMKNDKDYKRKVSKKEGENFCLKVLELQDILDEKIELRF